MTPSRFNFSPAPNALKSDLKKPRICPIWGQSDPLWSQTYNPWLKCSPEYWHLSVAVNFYGKCFLWTDIYRVELWNDSLLFSLCLKHVNTGTCCYITNLSYPTAHCSNAYVIIDGRYSFKCHVHLSIIMLSSLLIGLFQKENKVSKRIL